MEKIENAPEGGKKKSVYRVRNWSAYNAALVSRGSLTLWFDEAVLADWHAVSGKGKIYHNVAIQCALSLRSLFGLGLRQTEGFLTSLVSLLGVAVKIPDYSTLSRRADGLSIRPHRGAGDGRPVHLVVDSTGLKVFGEGEWKVRQHGAGKRRTWRRLHLGIDEATGEILAHALTSTDIGDPTMLEGLLDQVDADLGQVSADGAYDSFACHKTIVDRGARPVIPPRKGAAISPPREVKDAPPTRGDIVRRIIAIGRKGWKQESGYHRRSLAENGILRYKVIIGPNLRNRTISNQKTEAAIGVDILNRFRALGMPESVKIC